MPGPADEPNAQQQGAGKGSITRWEIQLRKGCLDLAILAALWPAPLYGLEILRRLAEGSDLVIPEGTLYPLLGRLRTEGWVKAEWVEATAGHPRRYYSLTPAGRRHARQMAQSWSRFSGSLDRLATPLRREDGGD